MKSLKLAGLCVVTMLMLGLVAAGSASAAVEALYGVCQKEASGTKYSGETCETKTGGTEEWGVGEIAGTEKAVMAGTLLLVDSKLGVEVSCTVEAVGLIGQKRIGRIEEINNTVCTNVKGCENTPTFEFRNLPWKTELAEIENEAKEKSLGATLVSEVSGKAAGWAMKCKVLKIESKDECTINTGLITDLGNRFTDGYFNGPTPRWLILLEFLNFTGHKANCSLGGSERGEIKNHFALLAYRISGGKPKDINLLLRIG
jgi:hypothetical protein